MIPPVYASTDLKTDLREVKDATREHIGVITENGRGRYIFGYAPAFEDEINTAAWEEANAERIIESIERGMADIARGDYVVGADAAIALAEKMRLARG